jgi:hypothetical protein
MTFRAIHLLQASRWAATASLLMLVAGCGGGGPSGPTGTVSGTIKHKGAVLTEKVSITFLSADGPVATGMNDSTGHYSLEFNGATAIPVGKYKVSLTPFNPGDTLNQNPEQFFDKATMSVKLPQVAKSSVPSKYANPNTSGIVRDVAAGNNTVDIDLPD